jgi:hypothetical protein
LSKATAKHKQTIQAAATTPPANKPTTMTTVKDLLLVNTTMVAEVMAAMMHRVLREARIITTALHPVTTGDDAGDIRSKHRCCHLSWQRNLIYPNNTFSSALCSV